MSVPFGLWGIIRRGDAALPDSMGQNAECAQGFPLGGRGCNRALRTRSVVTIGYSTHPRGRGPVGSNPVMDASSAFLPLRPPMNPKAPNGTPRILVVDDDVRLRDLLDRYLASQGFEVRAIPDARELDKWLQRDPPSLVVLDLMLPGEDGLAVCRRLRGAGENVPIIMLTAKGEDVDRIVGLEMGADDYLAKPFNPRELVARIHAVLRRARAAARARHPGRDR